MIELLMAAKRDQLARSISIGYMFFLKIMVQLAAVGLIYQRSCLLPDLSVDRR